MSNILADFASKNITAASSSAGASADDQTDVKTNVCGRLGITGAVEWTGIISGLDKSVNVLEEPHLFDVPYLVKHVFTSASSLHTFVLSEDDTLYAFGRNDRGQLGLGDKVARSVPTRVTLPVASKVVKVATGHGHSLVLLENGDVYACGGNTHGELGLGDAKAHYNVDHPALTKVPGLAAVKDVACGWEHSLACNVDGALFTFGHPQNGQLGHGTKGELLKPGKAGISFIDVTAPRRVESFVCKDARGKLTSEYPASAIRVGRVAAGRNHSLCIEDYSQDNPEEELHNFNRVFTWGFGGYGRLGHNSSDDELRPREVSFFTPTNAIVAKNPQRKVRVLTAGSSFSLTQAASGHVFFWGQMSNASRGEATMYPRMTEELYDYNNFQSVACGSNAIFCSATSATTVAWGVPVAGKWGLEGGAKSSRVPQFVEKLCGFDIPEVACGYGHVCFIATESNASNTFVRRHPNPNHPSNLNPEPVKTTPLSVFPVFRPAPVVASAAPAAGKKRGNPGLGGAGKKAKK
jgi:alpha-tubulin suppressor-like RCC1 family protein